MKKLKYCRPECLVQQMSVCDIVTVSLMEQGDGDLDNYIFPGRGV